jgi:methylmalonyl-CoA mutase cobalamin-binding domain/chain
MVVVGGGIFPEDDVHRLKEAGIREIFTPGTPIPDVVRWIRKPQIFSTFMILKIRIAFFQRTFI